VHGTHHAQLVDDVRKRLSHVLWIGGGPCVGKTTLARLLAGKYDLKIYNLDWHAVREHTLRPGTAAAAFARLSMD
jgi:adenylylsulfate kinase-like enzyme